MEKDELEKKLNSIAMAGRDIEEAIRYLCEIKRRGLDFPYYSPHNQDRADATLFDSLVLALTVSYARVFGKNNDRDGNRTRNISDSCVPEKYKLLHEALISLRDTEHAHSDMDAMGFNHLYLYDYDESHLPYGMSRVPPFDPWRKRWKDKVGDLLKMVQGKIIEEKKVLLEKKKEEDLKLRREIYEAERRFRHQAAPDP